jgi:hypothetical protein
LETNGVRESLILKREVDFGVRLVRPQVRAVSELVQLVGQTARPPTFNHKLVGNW